MSNPRDLFFWKDWRSEPGLRASSLAARGLWIEMLSIAAEHKPKGYVAISGRALDIDELARMVSASVEDVRELLAELERNGVFNRLRDGTIYCRRMVRGKHDATKTLRQQRYRERLRRGEVVHKPRQVDNCRRDGETPSPKRRRNRHAANENTSAKEGQVVALSQQKNGRGRNANVDGSPHLTTKEKISTLYLDPAGDASAVDKSGSGLSNKSERGEP